MNISVDFSDRSERSRVAYIWLGLATVLLVFALATYLRVRGAADSLSAEIVAAKYESSDAKQMEDDVSRIASAEMASARQRAEYRMALPWMEVLDAIESLPTLRVTTTKFDVDAGTAAVEVVGSDDAELLKAVDQLQAALPRWRVRIAQQTHADGQLAMSLRLEDNERPVNPQTRRKN